MTDILAPLALWFRAVFVDQFDGWVVLGFIAQGFFTMRFLVQWVASERARRSVIPIAFWFFSLGGGALLFIYAIHRQDPVFIAGQGLGLVIYIRNLWLIANERKSPLADAD
ncbi:lipid-A-disaccharide synthase N-terminal domain-containing protein [Aquibium sp. A9E412]|uniref:lipid-A-disaccharide synthase N-terminal domain-containing protein n=1 Tax=Aquibium sp. A9E412 TaxID=2976767 RepID=UPI0025B255A4|nr:lipid-A-disaccharide synthase N-terminal domain-containing protein [Aquibium sp. A9E412]MDN2566587.1 lipid-A-disaccharide synthase N-terminal domain-containing protein [Aquibium sp. A9E412]